MGDTDHVLVAPAFVSVSSPRMPGTLPRVYRNTSPYLCYSVINLHFSAHSETPDDWYKEY